MHLSWFGLSAFKIETKDAVIVTDPYSPAIARKPLRAKADIVTISAPLKPSHNHREGMQGTPFVIDHPGEFEIKGVFIQGIAVGNVPASSTVFTMDCEGLRLVHLGDMRQVPPGDVLERLNGVDVLFVPTGGGVTLHAADAVKIVHDIEPRVVIPMHFAHPRAPTEGVLSPVSLFLKEMGVSNVAPVDRLLVKKRELPTEETRVIVFQP